MAMTERAVAFEEVASYENRQMRVLNGRAARERANAKRADVVKIGLAVFAVLVYMLGLTFVSARITAAGAEVNALNEQIATLENDAAIADMTIGTKSSLERIESYAIKELGMIYPDPNDTYFLSEASSQAIASGRQSLSAAAVTEAAAETEEPAAETEQGFLSKVGSALSGLLGRSAQAAEVSGAASADRE
ncbi:MAG: hypothetical protein IK116_04995 [Firmicutes bacterium]|nr:hypothetical protein [Bacillota bacterium]